MRGSDLKSIGSLIRWLGPWAGDESLPRNVRRERWRLKTQSGTPIAADVYWPQQRRLGGGTAPAKIRGAYLIAQGMHYLGPSDPRLARFCQILSSAGFMVIAPGLPSYLDLRFARCSADELEVAARAALDRLPPEIGLTVFSISFGSWPAFELATRVPLDSVVCFGGYADFDDALRFCIHGGEGDDSIAHDPLNAPVLFMNLIETLPGRPRDAARLEHAWRTMVFRTWGRAELKKPGARADIAEVIARHLSPDERTLFLQGCGLLPGGAELFDEALELAGSQFAWADPRSAIERMRCPVTIAHGRDDDVIPWQQAERLRDLCTTVVPTRLFLTGMYGHTGSQRPTLGAAMGELRTLLGIAKALGSSGTPSY
jgi:pimeloyl-ACP methyl ester carboxylesterase